MRCRAVVTQVSWKLRLYRDALGGIIGIVLPSSDAKAVKATDNGVIVCACATLLEVQKETWQALRSGADWGPRRC